MLVSELISGVFHHFFPILWTQIMLGRPNWTNYHKFLSWDVPSRQKCWVPPKSSRTRPFLGLCPQNSVKLPIKTFYQNLVGCFLGEITFRIGMKCNKLKLKEVCVQHLNYPKLTDIIRVAPLRQARRCRAPFTYQYVC